MDFKSFCLNVMPWWSKDCNEKQNNFHKKSSEMKQTMQKPLNSLPDVIYFDGHLKHMAICKLVESN